MKLFMDIISWMKDHSHEGEAKFVVYRRLTSGGVEICQTPAIKYDVHPDGPEYMTVMDIQLYLIDNGYTLLREVHALANILQKKFNKPSNYFDVLMLASPLCEIFELSEDDARTLFNHWTYDDENTVVSKYHDIQLKTIEDVTELFRRIYADLHELFLIEKEIIFNENVPYELQKWYGYLVEMYDCDYFAEFSEDACEQYIRLIMQYFIDA